MSEDKKPEVGLYDENGNLKTLSDLLRYDAIDETEKFLKNIGENIGDESLQYDNGLLLAISLGKLQKNRVEKEFLLSFDDDTTFCENEKDYLRKVLSAGFKIRHVGEFANEDGIWERFYILWHDEFSILLFFDTFTWGDDGSWEKEGKDVPPPSRNSAKMYYNLLFKCDNRFNRHGVTSSGSFTQGYFNSDGSVYIDEKFDKLVKSEPKWKNCSYEQFNSRRDKWNKKMDDYFSNHEVYMCWSGDHDAREAIKYNIKNMNENAIFVKNWIKIPFLWLLHYMDTEKKDYDYEWINHHRLLSLGKETLRKIGYDPLGFVPTEKEK